MKAFTKGNLTAWAARISRQLHACRSCDSLKTPDKIRGTVPANITSLMEPSALFNLTVAGCALPLLLIPI